MLGTGILVEHWEPSSRYWPAHVAGFDAIIHRYTAALSVRRAAVADG